MAQPATRYAPVDDRGSPVLYALPDSWNAAINDGQRFRWAMNVGVTCNSPKRNLTWAEFLNGQFGVETLANDAYFLSLPHRSQRRKR